MKVPPLYKSQIEVPSDDHIAWILVDISNELGKISSSLFHIRRILESREQEKAP